MPRTQADVAEVAVSVPPESDEAAVRKAFGVKVDDVYDFFAVRNGERVEQLFMEQGISSRVHGSTGASMANRRIIQVAPGPRVAIEFAGGDAASTFGTRFGRSGTEAYSTNNALRTASMHSREWLMSDNYLQAKIDYEIEEVGDDSDGCRSRFNRASARRKWRLAFLRVGGRS